MNAATPMPHPVLARARTFGDVMRAHAAQRPDKPAFVASSGGVTTFAGYNDRVNRLWSALDVVRGERVAILSKNRPEYLEVYGLGKAGAIVVPLNWRLPADELARLIAHSAPVVVFADAAHRPLVERLRASLPTVRRFVCLDAAAEGWIAHEELLASGQPDEPRQSAQPHDTLCLIYTSGTTGRPKAVAVSHAAALGNGRAGATEALGLCEQDITLAVMPLFHAGGMWYHLFPSYATGCTTVVLPEFDPATVLKTLQDHRITNVHLVPTMISALLAHPDIGHTELARLRLLFYAASSMPAELLRRAMRAFGDCGFSQSYGSTEGGALTTLDPDDHRRALSAGAEHLLLSCGRPMRQRQLRIVDDDGQALPAGEVGEIEVRSPDLMTGYWRDQAATRAAFDEAGWLRTGDLGRVDDEGYVYIVDRKHDMIVTGGENVFPSEVEAQLYHDPEVQDAAVFGVPDPRWVERVEAAIVLRPGSQASAQALLARLRERLAGYQCPKAIHFVDTLPKNPAGKVLRKELRARYAAVLTYPPA